MGIAYNPTSRSWSIVPERTDYKTDYKTDNDTSRKTDYVTNSPYQTYGTYWNGSSWVTGWHTTTDYGAVQKEPYLPTYLRTESRTDYRTY